MGVICPSEPFLVQREMTSTADKASKRQRTKAEPPVTGRWLLTNLFMLLRQFGSQILGFGTFIFCVREGRIAITAFAGHQSAASLILEIAAHLNITIAVSLSITGLSIALWANEYRRHQRTRERLAARITILEKAIDPSRTSSRLTPQGMTSPGDL